MYTIYKFVLGLDTSHPAVEAKTSGVNQTAPKHWPAASASIYIRDLATCPLIDQFRFDVINIT